MQVNSSLACEQTQAAPLYVWQNGECTPLCHFRSDMRQVISRLVMVSHESCRETPAAGSGVQSPANVTACDRGRERDPHLRKKYNPCSHFAEDLKAPLGWERESLWQLPGWCIGSIWGVRVYASHTLCFVCFCCFLCSFLIPLPPTDSKPSLSVITMSESRTHLLCRIRFDFSLQLIQPQIHRVIWKHFTGRNSCQDVLWLWNRPWASLFVSGFQSRNHTM